MRRALALLAVAGLLVVAPAGAAAAQAPGCDVVSAELTWGFKETFRAYIDGSIANGEWTVADGATYDTPSFGFPADSGRIDPRDPNGSIAFAGSVRFTGHGGILDTTVANPVLVVLPSGSGILLLDVSGPTMEGDEGSVAFPNYEAGSEFDSVTVVADLGDCDLTGQPIGTDVVEDTDAPLARVSAVVAGVVVLAAILAGVLIMVRRRR